MIRAALMVSVLAFCIPTARAQQSSPDSLLLLVETTSVTTASCGGANSEFQAFRDGLVIGRSVEEDGELLLLRAPGTLAHLQQLAGELLTHRVGFATGDCTVPITTPNATFEATITWFGRNSRRNSFTVGNGGGAGPLCGADTEALYRAITTYLALAFASPEATGENLPIEPAPGC